MNYSDILNGSFELVGAFMTLFNVKAIMRDKETKGIHWGPIVYFTSWSAFNLWFYPANNLWFSFAGGVCIGLVNLTWLYLVWYYSRKKRNYG